MSLAGVGIEFYWKVKELDGVLERKKNTSRQIERIDGFTAEGEVLDFGLEKYCFLDFWFFLFRFCRECADEAERVFLIFCRGAERGGRQDQRGGQSRAIHPSPCGVGTHAHLHLRIAGKGIETDERKGCLPTSEPTKGSKEGKPKT